MEKIIKNQTFDEERALYHVMNTEVANCTFAGPADGESVLKEARDILVHDCEFSLRYPLWQRCARSEQTFRRLPLPRSNRPAEPLLPRCFRTP